VLEVTFLLVDWGDGNGDEEGVKSARRAADHVATGRTPEDPTHCSRSFEIRGGRNNRGVATEDK